MHIILKTNNQRPMKSVDYVGRFTRNYSRCTGAARQHGTTEGRGVDAVEVSSRRDVFVVRIFDKYSAALLPRSFCGSRVSSSLTVTSASLRLYAFRLSSSVFSTYKMSPFPSNRSATTAHSDRLNGDSELSGEYARQWSQAPFSLPRRERHRTRCTTCPAVHRRHRLGNRPPPQRRYLVHEPLEGERILIS